MNKGHKAIYEDVSKILELKPDDDLLEVACGNGYFVKEYASHVHGVAGLDLSELAVKLATSKNKDRVKAGPRNSCVEKHRVCLGKATGSVLLRTWVVFPGFPSLWTH